MKRIGVTGASGFVGTALVSALLARGDAVRAFSRTLPGTAPPGVEVVTLDLSAPLEPAEVAQVVNGLDAVVHLAGETVAGRWTKEKKQRIFDSRVQSTRNLVAGFRVCARPPGAFVCASASGFYGSRGDEPLIEESTPGSDFLAQVCIAWEREAMQAQSAGVRSVCVRQGLVLGPRGGALQAMLPPFRAGVGGPLGSGAQWWPWIHLDDDVAIFLLALDQTKCTGAINAVSPDLGTNARFARALGHALRRPSLAFAPAIALKALLGEFAESLLASQLMLPAKAQDLDFAWKHPTLERALLDLIDPNSGRVPATSRFEFSQTVAAPLAQVYRLFSDPARLEMLAPKDLRFRVLTPQPIEMRRGTVLEYKLTERGLPLRWKTLIASWEPEVRFVDYQLRGPYLLWRHQHDFKAASGGAIVRDTVDYALPLAPLSDILLPMVAGDVRQTFEYRRTRLPEILADYN